MDQHIIPQQTSHQYGDCEPTVSFDPNVYQYYPDTCAIQSQKLILEKYGIDMSADELREEAMMHGWYAEGYGTPINKVGELLRLHNVPFNCSEDNNIFNIASELAQHHQIIVAVDSNELHDRCGIMTKLEDWFMGEKPNHALIVAGLDTSDPTDVKVILTDPGTGELRVTYSESEFMDAWKDSNCFMVSTDVAPEEYLGDADFVGEVEFAGFSQEHLEYLGGLDLGDIDYDQLGEMLRNVGSLVIAAATVVKGISKWVNSTSSPEVEVGLGDGLAEIDHPIDGELAFPEHDYDDMGYSADFDAPFEDHDLADLNI